MSNFKNELKGCGPFLHDDPRDRPPAIFNGTTTLHFAAQGALSAVADHPAEKIGQRPAALARLVAGQRHPVHDTAVAVIVIDRIVQHAAVIPERHRADAPIEPAGELRPGLMLNRKFNSGALSSSVMSLKRTVCPTLT